MPPPQILDKYRQVHPQCCSNFEKDKFLSKAQKQRFMAHLDAYIDGDYNKYLNEFFYEPSNTKLGPPISLAPGEVLGHMRGLTPFSRRFSEASKFDQDPAEAAEYVRNLTTLSPRAMRDAFRLLFDSTATVSGHMMWSYRNPPHTDDPFVGIDQTDLGCRLGLPSFGVEEHVTFGHENLSTAHTPTCFDAGLGDKWRPGGHTEPLSGCAAKYDQGLPEVVHDSNTFYNISTKLFLS